MALVQISPNNRKLVLLSVFLIVNALIWYFSASKLLQTVIGDAGLNSTQTLLLWAAHFGTIAISLIAGTLLAKKILKKSFFLIWTIIGTFSPVLLFAINFSSTWVTLAISILFGVSLGLGMPSCMENFVQTTDPKVRGRYSGLIMFTSCVGTVSLAFLNIGSIFMTAVVLMVWRSIALIPLLSDNFHLVTSRSDNVTFGAVLKQRSFFLYIIPWLMFSMVNYLTIPIQTSVIGSSTLEFLMIIEGAIIGIFAIVSGHLIDIFGRKRIAMAGFVLVGIGYSILGLYPAEMISWYLYTVIDGIAWGIFYVMFVVLIWGDLSFSAKSEKYYAIGILPFFISKFLELGLTNYVTANISPYALFSFIAFFLFLAVLPLVYAPETLPEKQMRERELKNYVEKAKKIVAKEQIRNQKEKVTINKLSEPAENNEEYDAVKKLAEKYY